jgi:hypothetical protein
MIATDDNQQRADSARRDDRFVTRTKLRGAQGSPDASWCIRTYTWMSAIGATTASSKSTLLVLSPSAPGLLWRHEEKEDRMT